MDDIFAAFKNDPEFDAPLKEEVAESMRGKLTSAADCRTYALAGNATLTLVSKATGNRFTFKVRKPKQENGERRGPVSHFVSLMNGPDNESNFQYLGHMKEGQAGVRYEHGRKSKINFEAPSAKAFTWFWGKVTKGDLPESLEVWHEGSCCRCGRKLTVPSSVARGIGPECAGKMGM